MIELRYARTPDGDDRHLQYRYLKLGVDASGAMCPNGGWSKWIPVPEVITLHTREGDNDH